jgi:hypothetical protein
VKWPKLYCASYHRIPHISYSHWMLLCIFQQWKHWHAEQLDYCVRQGVDQFNRLPSIESICVHTFKEYNIRSEFRNTSFIPIPCVLILDLTHSRRTPLAKDHIEHLQFYSLQSTVHHPPSSTVHDPFSTALQSAAQPLQSPPSTISQRITALMEGLP